LEKNKEVSKKKPIYDVFNDEKRDILPQYNDPKAPDSFMLDDHGIVDVDARARGDWLSSRKEIRGKDLYSLDTEKTITSEFYTQQEMTKFKNLNQKKKKKKIRKKEKLELEPLNDKETTLDLGSRADSTKMKIDQMKEEEQKEKNKIGYNKALEKAKEETQILFEEDQQDAELSKVLQNTREISTKKKLEVAHMTAKFEEKLKNRQHKAEVKLEDPSLLFTATTEFVRGIQSTFDMQIKSKKKEEKDKDAMEVEETIEEDSIQREKMILEQAEKERKKRQKDQDTNEKQENKKKSKIKKARN